MQNYYNFIVELLQLMKKYYNHLNYIVYNLRDDLKWQRNFNFLIFYFVQSWNQLFKKISITNIVFKFVIYFLSKEKNKNINFQSWVTIFSLFSCTYLLNDVDTGWHIQWFIHITSLLQIISLKSIMTSEMNFQFVQFKKKQ